MCCKVAQVSDKKLLSLVTLRESLFEEVWDCCSQKHSSSPSIAERGWMSAEFCLLCHSCLHRVGWEVGAVTKLQVVWSNSVDVLTYVRVLRGSLFGTTRCECKIKTI